MYKRKLYEENDHKNFELSYLENYRKRIIKSGLKKYVKLSFQIII